MKSIQKLLKFLKFCWTISILKLNEEISRYNLVFLWWFIDPLINTAVLYVIMVPILGLRDDETAIFLLSGLIIWRLTISCLQGATNSIRSNHSLSLKIYIHKAAFVIRDVTSEMLKFMIAILVLLLVLVLLGNKTFNFGLLAVVILTAMLFCYAVSPWMAMAGALLSDLGRIVGYIFRLLFFVSGIFFPLSKVPLEWQSTFLLNPFALLIYQFREALLRSEPDILTHNLIGLTLFCLIFGAIGYYLLNRYNRILPKLIM